MSRLALPALGALAVLCIACAGPCKGNSVPKPWSRTEGQEVVVGGPSAQEMADAGLAEEPEPTFQGDGKLVHEPQITRVGPEVEGHLSPVADSYDHLYTAAAVADCPEGTELVDKRADKRSARIYCALPNGTRHGPWMSYHGNGKVKEIAPYVGGMRHGQVTAWTDKGRKESTFTWVDGDPTTGTTF